MKNLRLLILGLILVTAWLYLSRSVMDNVYAFYAVAVAAPLLLLGFLMIRYSFKKFRSRKVYVSQRYLDKFLNQNKHH